jgi:hypothetical protein
MKTTIIVGAPGRGKVAQMFATFREIACQKYRCAVAGINWRGRRYL